ncbi:MAG: c-type cytochrome [Planctomycetes bacterium]|nr:c-type cytochrome [Planctomycetota bacterium]
MKKGKHSFLGLADLAWIAIILVISYVLFKFGIGFFTGLGTGKGSIPIPSSIIFMYMGIVIIAIALYLTIDTDRMLLVFNPIVYLYSSEGNPSAGKNVIWIASVVAFPLVIGYYTYQRLLVKTVPPGDPPGIHFDLPGSFKDLQQPFKWTPENISKGGEIFTGLCQPCHGFLGDGKGWMARAWIPKPIDFRESGTIAQLAERYLFWRITEGGIGLPQGTIGYRSVMPRWKDALDNDTVWKVIQFAYVNAAQRPADVLEKDHYPEPPLGDGKDIYERKCWFCHGLNGDGNGPGVRWDGDNIMFPTPRDFTSGQFKIRTTPHGSLPSDDDLFRAISKGLPGSVMPSWEEVLTEEERRKVMDYIKGFNDRFKTEEVPKPIVTIAASEPSVTEAMKEKGRELFKSTKCFLCHGEEGGANGPITVELKNQWDMPFVARDLTAGWTYRGGNELKDIFRAITTGLNGTPMGPYAEILTDDERWSLAAFVKSISRPVEPGVQVVLDSKLITGEIPMDADNPLWQGIEPLGLELAGQLIAVPRQFTPSINHARVRSVHNGNEIAFHIEWNDSTNMQDETFKDAVAIQFPTKALGGDIPKPTLAHGQEKVNVNIWHWKSFWKAGVRQELLNVEEPYVEAAVKELNVERGFVAPLTLQPPENQHVSGRGYWNGKRGLWQVVMKRKLNTGDSNDVKFEQGEFTLFSLGIWDGSNGDIGSKKSITVWYYLFPEAPARGGVYFYALVSIIMAAAAEMWLVGWIRRKPSA